MCEGLHAVDKIFQYWKTYHIDVSTDGVDGFIRVGKIRSKKIGRKIQTMIDCWEDIRDEMDILYKKLERKHAKKEKKNVSG